MAACCTGCNAFMHGYTWQQARNSYYIVNGDKHNFGDRRLKYTQGFYKGSELSAFLSEANYRGKPAFIYEYQAADKRRGIQLFYPSIDSVFIFEQPKKNCTCSAFKEARKMDEHERLTYEKLKKQV